MYLATSGDPTKHGDVPSQHQGMRSEFSLRPPSDELHDVPKPGSSILCNQKGDQARCSCSAIPLEWLRERSGFPKWFSFSVNLHIVPNGATTHDESSIASDTAQAGEEAAPRPVRDRYTTSKKLIVQVISEKKKKKMENKKCPIQLFCANF